jgi:hypothetical protein
VIELNSSPCKEKKYAQVKTSKDLYRKHVRGAASDIKQMKKVKLENTPVTIDQLNATRAANQLKARAIKAKEKQLLFFLWSEFLL